MRRDLLGLLFALGGLARLGVFDYVAQRLGLRCEHEGASESSLLLGVFSLFFLLSAAEPHGAGGSSGELLPRSFVVLCCVGLFNNFVVHFAYKKY